MVDVPALGKVTVGRAFRGLCGGMVFTALDVFSAGLPPLEDGRPVAGSPLFDYIVKRLFDSFDLPGGVAKYYRWMLVPSSDRLGRWRPVRSLARRMISEEWPAIKADLDAGRPCPLGLVTVRTANPARLGRNHQVLACGYRLSGQHVTLDVYDPNTDRSSADDAWIKFSLADASSRARITHNVGIGDDIRGAFRVRYRPVHPPIPLLG